MHQRTLAEYGGPTELPMVSMAYIGMASAQTIQNNLEAVLSLAGPEGNVRSFLDDGDRLQPLLQQLALGPGAPAMVSTLLDQLETQSQTPRPPRQPLPDPLTPRELEVLGLVASGMSNAQIADHMVVALSTVKKHANHIFGKLSVRNRTEAVAKARALDIL